MPSGVLNMFKDDALGDYEDDPSSHQGRIRTFAHLRGNWATYVYVPCKYKIQTLKIGIILCNPQLSHAPSPSPDRYFEI